MPRKRMSRWKQFFLALSQILNQEQVKDIKIDELTKIIYELKSQLTDTFEYDQIEIRKHEISQIENFLLLIISHILNKIDSKVRFDMKKFRQNVL